MKLRALSLMTAALIPAVSLAAVPAATAQQVSPAASYQLPQRWNDDFKPGTRCTPPGTRATYVEASRRWFDQTDATSVANRNDEPAPVTHTVTETREQTTTISATVKGEGELAKLMTNAYGFNYVNKIYWKFGQTVGPYQIGPNQQGKLVWGFMMLDADAQDVICSEDQTWQPTGKPYSFTIPESRYSELRLDDAPVFG